MSDTKTVELPLTKSERNHLANIERRDERRERATKRREAKDARDARLKAITDEYRPKIEKLRVEASEKRAKVWADWQKEREAAA